MTPEQARAGFAAARRAILATTNADGSPHLVPFVFALEDDAIFCVVDRKPKRTRALRRLENIRREPRVAALADHYDEDWSALWWVRVDGRARLLEDDTTAARGREALERKYPQYREDAPEDLVIVIESLRWRWWSAT